MAEYIIFEGVRVINILEQWTYVDDFGNEATLRQLVRDWHMEVARIIDAQSRTDAGAWNADDFVGALHARDRIERGILDKPADVRDAVSLETRVVDTAFEAVTVEDGTSIVLRFGGLPGEARNWWWHRLPARGSIREELDSWREHPE